MIALLMSWTAAAADPAALAELEARRTLPADVQVTPRVLSFAGGHRVQLAMHLAGLPVHGVAPVVSLSPDGALRRSRVPTWTTPGPLASEIPEDVAVDVARGVLAHLGRGALWPPRAERAWWAGDGQPQRVWTVVGSTASPTATWRVHVDAATGAVVRTERTSREADGLVFPTNPVLSEPVRVELQNLVSATSLDGTQAYARSCDEWQLEDSLFGVRACHEASAHATPDAGGHYLFDPDPGSVDDPFAEVHAYHHIDLISTWMRERFAFELPYAPVQATLNFPMANAFYGDFDGDGVPDLSFGHAESGVDFGHDADVVYHEFGHAIVEELAPSLPFVQADAWGIEWVSGAVNEGAADVWAMLLTGDPLVGEYAGSGFDRPAIRDLSELRICPDDLRGEVHADGEILGAFGWALIQHGNVGPELTAELLYGAIPLWGQQLDWAIVGASFGLTADDLLAAGAIDDVTYDSVMALLSVSGMVGCGRSVALDDGRERELLLPTLGIQGDLERLPAGVQLTLEVPPDAIGVKVKIPDFDGPDGMGWVLHGRAGQRVRHDYTELEALGLGFATPAEFDWMVEGDVGEQIVVLAEHSDPPVVPGETLFLALASRNAGGLVPFDLDYGEISISAHVVRPGATLFKEPAAGCGCASTATPTPWVLALLLVVAGRRRPS